MIVWLFKPLELIVPYVRTTYWLDGPSLVVKRPFRKPVFIRIDELDEIGVETTDQGPFMEDVFWNLKHGDMRIRIPDPHPVFRQLMNRFDSLEGFDWKPFAEAMTCADNHYFLCWKRPPRPEISVAI